MSSVNWLTAEQTRSATRGDTPRMPLTRRTGADIATDNTHATLSPILAAPTVRMIQPDDAGPT